MYKVFEMLDENDPVNTFHQLVEIKRRTPIVELIFPLLCGFFKNGILVIQQMPLIMFVNFWNTQKM